MESRDVKAYGEACRDAYGETYKEAYQAYDIWAWS